MAPRRSGRLAPSQQSVAESTRTNLPCKPVEVIHNGKKRSQESDAPPTADVPSTGTTFTVPDVSSTPKRRRISGTVPVTPTPSMVGVLNASSDRNSDDSIISSFRNRPAEPHRTNAPLATPGGSKVVAYPEKANEPSPSNPGVPRPTTTTGNLLEEGCNHLIKADPRLRPVVEKHYCRMFGPEGLEETIDPFQSLCSGIMAQQVSGAAAKSIKKRFVALFTRGDVEAQDDEVVLSFPTPPQVAALDIATLRTAGLSGRKSEYIKGLAEKFVSGELSAELLIKASDEEVMEKLTAVRGLGKWSVEMFACFALKRMDVFSTGDLGVQRGMAAYMGKDVSKLKAKGGKWKYMSEKDMLEHSQRFAPYRSLFMWYMWRVEDVDVDALQKK
ncbi:MAG: 3-methyladenine DNA glycosylase [Candelina submexicana]|nr:MAG: 3-methyladenine DNA glycosylase [Candelina submexicana]